MIAWLRRLAAGWRSQARRATAARDAEIMREALGFAEMRGGWPCRYCMASGSAGWCEPMPARHGCTGRVPLPIPRARALPKKEP